MHKVHERAHASEIEDCLTHVSFHMYVRMYVHRLINNIILSCVQYRWNILHINYAICMYVPLGKIVTRNNSSNAVSGPIL